MSVSLTNASPPPVVNKWVIALTVMFGAFMAVMDISVVNVSLPYMMGSFGKNLSAITWVATSYSIAEIIMVTMTGWWSALLGRKRLYLLSFALFTVGSILCGTAHTFSQMMVYRVIQGIGGGCLIPVSQAILRESFPTEEQGMAMAVYGMGVVLAPAAGPILGGWLTDRFGWPAIFYINVPVCLVGMALVMAFLHDPPYLRRGVGKIDWLGIGLLAVTLTGLQVVLERGQQDDWFQSHGIILGTAITAVAFVLFLFWELRAEHPVVNLRLLKNGPLAIGSSLGIILSIGLFGTSFIFPQFTQDLLGYSALDAGLILSPRALALLVAMPVVGYLYRHTDVRALIVFGLGLILWSYWDLAHLSLSAGFRDLVPILVIMGLGMPFVFVTISTVSLSTVSRRDMTDAASFYTLARRTGGNLGYALVATLVARGTQIHRTDLVTNISPLNSNYRRFHDALLGLLHTRGLPALGAQRTALALTDATINRQATMLAYNDLAFTLGALFLVFIPFLFFLPGRPLAGSKDSALTH